MIIETWTTHAGRTITAKLETTTDRVSLDVDGIWAGEGRWVRNATIDCAAQLVRDDADATEAVYSDLDDSLRNQL
jgi:hypothetical protein